jgi:hypothetical protein
MDFNLSSSVLEAFEELNTLNESSLKTWRISYYEDEVKKSFIVQAASKEEAEQIGWSRVDADSLYVSEVVNEDTEPSAPFKAIYAGSKFVPDAVRSKLENEAFADYNSKREALKADFEKVLLYENQFNRDAATLATVLDGKYECIVYGQNEEDYYMSNQSWNYRRSHITLHVGTKLTVGGVSCTEIDNPHDYPLYIGNRKVLRKYNSASNYVRHDSDAQVVYDKAHEEAEAKLLAMAKKYFPDATLDEVPSNHRVVINLTKEYDVAKAAYDKAISEYEVSEEEIRAEDERIRNEIAASYGSGRYNGD